MGIEPLTEDLYDDPEKDDNDIPLNTPKRYSSDTDEEDTTYVNEDESETETQDEINDDFDNVRSTDSNVSDDEDEPKPEQNDLLYPGAPITVAESLLAILTVALTHSLTGECLSSILQLIALHCIGNINKKLCKYCQSKNDNSFFIELPLMNQLQAMFLRPDFVEKLQFRFHRVKKAKGLFMRFKLYNGYYGCSRCKIRGTRYKVGKSTVQVYPYDERMHLRTQEEVQNDAKASIELGLTKLLLRLWFDPTLANEPYSLSGVLHVIDADLRNMQPPSFVQRMPRAIKTYLSLWKAQEYKLWLIYYSVPILLGVMNQEYFDHHLQLLSAVYLLSRDSISFDQIEVARNHLRSYISKFADFYGVRNMSMNVHQLLHLPDVVLDLGPLWVYSCFFLEDLNGKLSKLIHGSRHAGLQVCSGASIYMNLYVLIGTLPVDSTVRKFCDQLRCNKKKSRIVEIIDPKTYVLGSLQHLDEVSFNIRAVLAKSLDIKNGNIQVFYRLERKGVLFSSAKYSRSNKKVSHYVSYTHEKRLVETLQIFKCEVVGSDEDVFFSVSKEAEKLSPSAWLSLLDRLSLIQEEEEIIFVAAPATLERQVSAL
ncbi:PREDICTED: uncharacterized protein LOC105449147 [Wasmannia auropunctata]|uniref:uncharacterized protein LOC105449147 n=1 Tax=Wasmannia auropunctata TaxID=64793 RepID=UPI0005EDEA9E|nr:PREDICTED: uncharacterized protein LOC105449147 [Wasmannia auropunctata]